MSQTLPIRVTAAAVLLIALGIIFVLQNPPSNGGQPPMEKALVVERPGIAKPEKLPDPGGIENCFQVAPNLWIGSQPEGANGVQSLAAMGIQTIVSVDGAAPDIAAFRGVRCIHLPIGYDGITRDQQLALAGILSNPEAYGNVYLHCHHGKHRGPAAAAATLRCIDPQFTTGRAEAFLKQAGTDPRYAGLYRDVREATPATNEERTRSFQYTNRALVGGLVERMVAIDETWERIRACEKAGWATPPEHPDVKPAHEALQLVEHYRELGRLPSLPGGEFAKYLKEAEAAAISLEMKLQMKEDSSPLQSAFERNANLCVECHAVTRDRKSR